MTCKTCKFLDVPEENGKIKPRANKSYKCLVEIPLPILPASITGAYDFRWPPGRKFMSPDEGKDCPCYQERGVTPCVCHQGSVCTEACRIYHHEGCGNDDQRAES